MRLSVAVGVLAAFGCVKVPEFQHRDGGAVTDDADDGGTGSDGSMPFEGNVTATGTPPTVTLPGLYTMVFSSTGFRFPNSLKIGGVEVFAPNTTDASRCNVEHGVGVSYAAAPVVTGVDVTGLSNTQHDVDIEMTGTLAKVSIDWGGAFTNCSGMPAGRTTYTFFPDGRISRMDLAGLTPSSSASMCRCSGSDSTWELTAYHSFLESAVAPVAPSTVDRGVGVNTQITEPVACLSGTGSMAPRIAIGWRAHAYQRFRRLSGSPATGTFAAVGDMMLPTQSNIGGSGYLGSTRTTMTIGRGTECSDLKARTLPFTADPHIEITNSLGANQLGLALDGIYGGETAGTSFLQAGYPYGATSPVTIKARAGDVVPPFALWLDMTGASTITLSRTPASARATWYTVQDMLPRPGHKVFWFPDGLSGDATITIEAQ